MTGRRDSRAALALAALGALAACASGCSPLAWGVAGGVAGICAYAPSRWNHAYQVRYQPVATRVVDADTADVRLGFVELDDFGWMRDTLQARQVLDTLQALHARTNVAVVVYAHGWRHNAKDGDADLEAFQATLRHLARQLDGADFREGRRELTGDAGLTVFGVYVGWRGQAWPELGRHVPVLGPAILDLPVYFTSFGRKQTAGVVGAGDVRGFLLRLDDLHREINDQARRDPATVKPLGLVYVGHSYGGHLMFSALGQRIEDNMGSAIAGATALDSAGLSRRTYPAERGVPTLTCRRLVRGVGDLVVLVNPAIEASAYRRIDGMTRSARFRGDQLPLMVTVSAENDAARNGLFAAMRWLQLAGRARLGREQSRLEGRAFGAYAPQVTHQMELTSLDAETRARARRKVIEEGRDQLTVLRAARRARGPDGTEPGPDAGTLFGEHVHGVVRMAATEGFDRPVPALVIRSRRDVIHGHSDFFRAEFVNWLTDYVLAIEQVRLANAVRAKRGG